MTDRLSVHALDPAGATDGQVPTYDAAAGRVAWADGGSGSTDQLARIEARLTALELGGSFPVAQFTQSTEAGASPLAVTFTDTSAGTPNAWSWDFGDGATSTVQNPSHTYSTPGTYTVRLEATNAYGDDIETKVGLISVTGARPDAWDPVTMLGADALHPNNTGMSYLADAYEWALADAGETPATGTPVYAYGDSWTASDSQNTPGQRAIQQLVSRLTLGTVTNLAVNGYKAGDCAARAIGTDGTFTAGTSGLVALPNVGLNDLAAADTALNRTAVKNYLRSLLAACSAAERIEQTAFTYAGTWTATNSVATSSGGSNSGTPSDGASATYTITTPGTYYLLAVGTDGSAYNGGKFTIAQGGTTLATLDLHAQAMNTGNKLTGGYGPVCVRLNNVQAGTLTMTFSANGRSSAQGWLDALVRIAAAPNTILAVKPIEVTSSTYAKPALLDFIRKQYDALATEFGSHVIVCDPDPTWTGPPPSGAQDLATLRGTPAYTAGKFGNALSGGVLGGGSTSWDSSIGTLEAWIKTTSTGTIVAVGNNGAATNGTWIGASGGKAAMGNSTLNAVTSTVTVNDNAWHHLAYTVNGSVARFWVDGALALERTFTGALTMGPGTNAIGGFGTSTAYDWSGQIDEVRVSKIVRYTAAFTPPTAAFTVDANTSSLYHLEASGSDSVTV